MSRESLKKYVEILNKHLEFITNFDIKDEEEGKHLEDVMDAISDILEEAAKEPETQEEKPEVSEKDDSELKAKESELENLRRELKETKEILDTELPEDMMKKMKKKLKKEFEEKSSEEIDALKAEIEKLRTAPGKSETSSEDENLKKSLTEKEEQIKTLEKEIDDLKKSSPAPADEDTDKIKKKIRSEIEKEYKDKIKTLEQKLAEKPAAAVATNECVESEEGPVEKPSDKNDVAGWELWLEENPEDKDGIENVKRIESEARKSKDFGLLADVLICRFNSGIYSSDEEGVKLIKEVAQIQEIELDNTEEALLALKVIFDLHPDDDSLLADLKRLAITGNHWELYTSELLATIAEIKNNKTIGKLYVEAGRAYNERLGNTHDALVMFEKALSADASCGDALDELASIYKGELNWEKLISTLKKRISITSDNNEKVFYLREIARVQYEKLRDDFLAAATFEEVFSIIPDDMEAILGLEAIYRKHDLHEQMSGLLSRKIESVESAEEARNARRELAFLYARELNEHNKAIDILEHLIEVLPGDLEMLRLLKDLYEGTGRMRGFMKIASMLADKTEDEEEKITLFKRIATEHLMNSTMHLKAAEAFEMVIKVRPDEEYIYGQLEDIYRAEEQWDQLCNVYKRHAAVLEEDIPKSKILRALGGVYLDKLKNIDVAISTLEESIALKDNAQGTWELISRAYYTNESWSEALPYYEKLAEATEGEIRAKHLKCAGICLFKLGELDKAEDILHKAYATLKKDAELIEIIADLYSEKEQWTRSINYYEKAIASSGNENLQSDLIFKAASIYSDRLDDEANAVGLYKKLIEMIPGHFKATRILADHFFKTEDWQSALPLFHVMVTEIGESSKSEKVELFLKAGKVALKAGDIERAASYLEKARELEPTSLNVLMELAELRYMREEWDGALSLYQALLVAHRDNLSNNQVAVIYTKLGIIKEKKGDTLKALSFYDKALEFNQSCKDAVNAVMRLRTENQDYEKVASIKFKQINAEKDEDRKLELMGDLIRFYIETAKDPESAIEIQEEAISMRPGDRQILNDALDLYHLTERWDKVVTTVLKLADLEDPGLLRSKYHYSAGLIFEEEIGDDTSALEQFNFCLEQDDENDEVFDRIIRIYKKREDWHSVVKAIRKQLKKRPELQRDLQTWDTLGEIYLDKMGDIETALAAFEAAANIAQETPRYLQLADLYIQAGPQHIEKAQKAWMRVLVDDQSQVDIIRKVLETAIAVHDKDLAWNMCGVLGAYNAASDKEKLFFEKYSSKNLVRATSILTDDHWKILASPWEDEDLNILFRGMGHYMALNEAKKHSVYNLDRKNRINIDTDKRDWVRAYEYTNRTLMIKTRPDLFESQGLAAKVLLANCKEDNSLLPAWIADVKAFQNMDEAHAAYFFARELSYLRPERFFRRAAESPTTMFNALYAALEITTKYKTPKLEDGQNAAIKAIGDYLKNAVPTATLDTIKPIAKRIVEKDIQNTVVKWINGNARTSIRAATLITNDLKRSISWTLDEGDELTGIKAKERVAEVIRFVLSPEYYELRKAVGLSIK
ncbi:tetratricopeptide repeat protein [Myxococcota bacterium]|nr:tetratricopeptide repeat protein [Myxococcota bacterium]MBU1381106.1 tetratricopeptide repeat protein [Myxococcota bacterium]MBU1498231.1 tetratricopeptide repeat protein [Myxococcota bacterium]